MYIYTHTYIQLFEWRATLRECVWACGYVRVCAYIYIYLHIEIYVCVERKRKGYTYTYV